MIAASGITETFKRRGNITIEHPCFHPHPRNVVATPIGVA